MKILRKILWSQVYKKRIAGCVVSFPKSGRTWLRVMLAKYYALCYDVPVSTNTFKMHKANRDVPFIHFTHLKDGKESGEARARRLAQLKDKRIVFLVRDPRDVIVSYFFQQTKRKQLFKGDMSTFVRDAQYGVNAIVEYMNDVLRAQASFEEFLMIRYEDIHKDPGGILRQVVAFFGADVDSVLIDESVEYAKFENMKKLEKKRELDEYRMQPGDKDDKESFKVRKGKVGGYTEYLSNEDQAYVDEVLKDLDPSFGYSA